MLRKWVGLGVGSHHFPIFLDIGLGEVKSHIPFKFNFSWLDDGDFIDLVNYSWISFVGTNSKLAAIQYVANLKKMK